jgi:hypothetical protein
MLRPCGPGEAWTDSLAMSRRSTDSPQGRNASGDDGEPDEFECMNAVQPRPWERCDFRVPPRAIGGEDGGSETYERHAEPSKHIPSVSGSATYHGHGQTLRPYAGMLDTTWSLSSRKHRLR